MTIFTMQVQQSGQEQGTCRVRADGIRAAYERIRTERPRYATARLICIGIKEETTR